MRRSLRQLGLPLLFAAGIHAALLAFIVPGAPVTIAPLAQPVVMQLVIRQSAPVLADLPAPPVKRTTRAMPSKSRTAAAPIAEALAPAVVTAPVDELAPVPVRAPVPDAGEMMRLARRDIAGIARELNQEKAGRDKVFSSAIQAKLDLRFAEAHAAARTEWYQAAKIEEITTAASGGARIYRITTALGAFCMRYPANGGRPSYSTCDG